MARQFATSPREYQPADWKAIAARLFRSFGDRDISLRCAGVAFFGFLSLFPALALSVSLYGLIVDRSELQTQLAVLQPIIPDTIYQVIAERLSALVSVPSQNLGFGFLLSAGLAFWSGSRGINALVDTLGAAYREPDDRSFLAQATLSIALTLGGMLTILVLLSSIALLPIAASILPLPETVEATILAARWPLIALFVFAALTALYKWAPHRNPPQFRWTALGALCGTVGLMALSLGFSLYVENFTNYSATFGSLSVAVVLLFWFYYSALIVAISAQLNAESELQTRQDSTVGPDQPMGDRGAFVADNTPK